MKIDEEDQKTISSEDVVCSGRCGVALCDRRGLISHDARTLLVPSGSCIRVFSLSSGEPVRSLFGFHEAFIIAICPSPLNKVHVLSCSIDGVVARWDSTDFALISKNRLVEDSTKVQVFLANNHSPSCVYVCHEKIDGKAKNSLWIRNLSFEDSPRQLGVGCSSNPSLFGISANSDLVAWIDGNQQLSVMRCSTPAAISVVRRGRGRATSLAVHPTDELVAVGDQDGAIFIHSGPFFQTDGRGDGRRSSGPAPAMKLHWHSMPVADLHLSTNFIYSVGSEGVLVRWDLESEEKQFLPRLGMPIKHLAVAHNEKFVVCAHSDNTMTVVQAPNTVHRVIQGLVQRGFTGGHGNPVPADLPMLVDPRKGLLVLSGRPGQLQFYSLEQDRQASVLDVTGENLATDFKLQYEIKKGINSEVILADFSPDGRYLATVEFKTALSVMCKLKFWRWNDERSELEPDTTALMPHLRQKPVALRMGLREGRHFCVTAGPTSFKLWTVVRGGTEDQLFWQSVDERSYRQLQCRALALSEDHSILAVAFGHMITLWHIDLNSGSGFDGLEDEGDLRLIGELCTRGNTQEILSLEFGRGECSTILLAAGTKALAAWDLLSLERLWTAQGTVRQIIADPHSSNMAALVMKNSRAPNSLVVFRPDKTIEIPIAQVPLDQDDLIRCAVWVRTSQLERLDTAKRRAHPQAVSWQSKGALLAMGKRDKLYHFVRKEDAEQQPKDSDQLDIHQITEASTNLDSLMSPFGVHLSSLNVIRATSGDHNDTGRGVLGIDDSLSGASQRVVDRLLQIPTHVMPSAAILAESFIRALWLDRDEEAEGETMTNGYSKKGRTDGADSDLFDSDASDVDSVEILTGPKKARYPADKPEEVDALQLLEGELRAEKIRLPKLKDYEWLQHIAVKKADKKRQKVE